MGFTEPTARWHFDLAWNIRLAIGTRLAFQRSAQQKGEPGFLKGAGAVLPDPASV